MILLITLVVMIIWKFLVNLLFFVHSFHAEIMVSQATRDGMFMRKVLELVLEGIKPIVVLIGQGA